MKRSGRNPALDITRAFALACVVGNHFFMNNGFLYQQLIGVRMYAVTLMYSATMLCNTLFLMLSGYLMNTRKPNARYFQKIGKTLGIYFLASICCYLCMYITQEDGALHGTLGEMLSMIVSFRAAPYSWYVEMYIGLFFLIPYLNILYHGLQTQRQKQVLILIFACLTSLPGITNILTYSVEEGLRYAVISAARLPLLPTWWQLAYPITFYLCGAYLQEYPLRLTFFQSLLAALGSVILAGTVDFLLNYNTSYLYASWQHESSILYLFQGFFVFHFLVRLDCQAMGARSRKFWAKVSDLSLGAYLVSWIFDRLLYPYMNAIQPNPAYNFVFFPVMVLAVLTCALLLSALLNSIYHAFSRLCIRVFSRQAAAK